MQVSLSESMDKVLSYQLCLVKLISQSDKFNAFKPANFVTIPHGEHNKLYQGRPILLTLKTWRATRNASLVLQKKRKKKKNQLTCLFSFLNDIDFKNN